jgi:hypothetical protein
MGGAGSKCGAKEKRIQGFARENLRKRDKWEDLGAYARILIKCIL